MNLKMEEGEGLIFAILKEELRKRGIKYVNDFGLRYFYSDGTSFGICSNCYWRKRKQLEGYNNVSSTFYANELVKLKRFNYNHSIRVQGQCYNNFLKEISSYKLGNVMVIYIFGSEKITGYFFLASGDDYDAVNKFHNDKDVFESAVRSGASHIQEVVDKYQFRNLADPFFSSHVVDELFTRTSRNDVVGNLTPKQFQTLNVVATGCVQSKQIASTMGVSPKQVDRHIRALKSIFRVNGRCQLVEIARDFI